MGSLSRGLCRIPVVDQGRLVGAQSIRSPRGACGAKWHQGPGDDAQGRMLSRRGSRAKAVRSGRITGGVVQPEPWLHLQALKARLEHRSKNPLHNNKNEASFTRNFYLQNRGHLCMF